MINSDRDKPCSIQDIATLKADILSASKRLDKNEKRTDHIHKLAASLESLTEQLKIQNARWEKMFEVFDHRMTAQGERIGKLEVQEISLEKKILEQRAKKWDSIFISVGTAIVIAVVFYFLGYLGL